MITFLKTLAAIFAMTLVVPITIAAMSSSWKFGFRAWFEYMKIMGGMVLIAAGISGALLLLSMI